jgi:hypothetical protein
MTLAMARPVTARRWIVAAGAVAMASCTRINDSADHVASLEFSSFPSPAVVAGDTLRDSLGFAAPLRAIAFNSGGRVVANPEVSYLALDTGLTITPAGLVIARRRSGQVNILASTSGIQTRAVPLLIARSPDSVAFGGPTRDTIAYDRLNPSSATHTSDDLAVRVITKDTAGGITSTQGWVVSYQLTFRNSVVAAGDTTVVSLRDEALRRSHVDTTASSGTAARRVRLNLVGFTPPDVDSVLVTATVRHKGTQVRGSPLRFVILLRPR